MSLVGREDQLSALLGAMPGWYLVVGDAGDGKTRFVAEVAVGCRPPPWPKRIGLLRS